MKAAGALVQLALVALVAIALGQECHSDCWAATDALGRALVNSSTTRGPQPNKHVGIFYFLSAERDYGPYDISKILRGEAQWGPKWSDHHWGKPALGYYRISDEWVIRKHGQLLANAGVDTVTFDVTNTLTFNTEWNTIGRIWLDLRSKGIKAPSFMFMTWGESGKTMNALYDALYSQNLYKDLWFIWNGKPLIFYNPDTFNGVRPEVQNFFTLRRAWAWHDPNGWYGDGKGAWPWMDNWPQPGGFSPEGVLEQGCVEVAQGPLGIGPGRTSDGSCNCLTQPATTERTAQGLYFQQLWDRVLQLDPPFVFITGWNEWFAMRFIADGPMRFAGKDINAGDTYFVDEYSPEYSRDIEPVSDGFTDNYYYQMVNNIRRFKGVAKETQASPGKTIKMNADYTQWNGVNPVFQDDWDDVWTRNHPQMGGDKIILTDNSGRNDLCVMQMTCSSANLFVLLRARGEWFNKNATQNNWLFIDSDNNYQTGWFGFDHLVDPASQMVKSYSGGQWKFAGKIKQYWVGNNYHASIPLKALKISHTINLQFKWFSSEAFPGDIMDFMLKGDAAPNGRFTFHYTNKVPVKAKHN